MGFSLPRRLHDARCALTAPFHPCRNSCEPRRSAFLWHYPSAGLSTFCPRVSPAKPELRGIAPDGVRTFLIWLAPNAILRPSKTNPSLHDDLDFNKRWWKVISARLKTLKQYCSHLIGKELPALTHTLSPRRGFLRLESAGCFMRITNPAVGVFRSAGSVSPSPGGEGRDEGGLKTTIPASLCVATTFLQTL